MNVCKLVTLLHPLKIRFQNKRPAYILVGILWFLTLTYPVQLLALKREMSYVTYLYRCMTASRADTIWEQLELINVGVFVLVPVLVVIATTTWLLAFLRKVTGVTKHGLRVVTKGLPAEITSTRVM